MNTKSKALVKSRNIASVSLPLSIAENTSLVNVSNAVVVEWLDLRPDWDSDQILLIHK